MVVGKNVSPSCQTYNIPSRAVEGAKWIMGVKLDRQGALGAPGGQHVPGPGNYDPDYKSVQPTLPKFSIKGRYPDARRMEVPGPGTYQKGFGDKLASPSFGFGRGPQRTPLVRSGVPGPGAYRVPVSIGNVLSYALPVKDEQFKYV